MSIVLYKTLLLDGDPKKSIITWFYPVSMDEYEQGIFEESWKETYQKLFKPAKLDNLKSFPESVAPYLVYRTQYPGLSLSIDIGGGSSDIAVFEKEENMPRFISSFKFAGNSVFGDGFTSTEFRNNSDNNGFVSTFLEEITKIIKKGTQKEEILDDILKDRKDSSDFSSFLFSLEKDPDINFSYTSLLRQDKKLKLTILIYYGAVIYYSANLMKRNGSISIPQNILLSGTASKTASIIDSSADLKHLSEFFKLLFEKVLETTSEIKIKIALAKEPKEITCKGALKLEGNHELGNSPVLFWIGGKSNDVWTEALNKETDINKTPKYRDISENTEVLIENSIKEFYDLLDDYVSNINIEAKYGIDTEAYKIFKQMRANNIKDYLRQGLKAYYKNPDKHIEETLFFYTLTGILNKLAYELSQKQDN